MVQTVLWTTGISQLFSDKVIDAPVAPLIVGRPRDSAVVAFPQEQFLDKVMVFTGAVVQTVLTVWRYRSYSSSWSSPSLSLRRGRSAWSL